MTWITVHADMNPRYRPDVGIRFLTEELAFESDQECAQFLCDHGAENLFLQGENGVRLVTSKAGSIFSSAKETAFRKVDIKGQV